MKKKTNRIGDALAGFFIILALMAIIPLMTSFGDSGSGEIDNIVEEELVTIEAGTYIFDEDIELPTSAGELEFVCKFTENETSVDIVGHTIGYTDGRIVYGCTSLIFNGSSQAQEWVLVTSNKPTWSMDGFRTVVVPKDQQVKLSFGTWFKTFTTRVEFPNDEEGDFGETPAYKENTIYAGTYRFNDLPNVSEGYIENDNYTIPINFTVSVSTVELGTITLYHSELSHIYTIDTQGNGEFNINSKVVNASQNLIDYLSSLGIPSVFDQSIRIYLGDTATNGEFIYVEQLNDTFGTVLTITDTIIKTFTVTKDTEVSAEAFNWFTTNTKMLIKAGTYKWNDVLTKPTEDLAVNDIYNLPFSIPSFVFDVTQENADYINSELASQGIDYRISAGSYKMFNNFDGVELVGYNTEFIMFYHNRQCSSAPYTPPELIKTLYGAVEPYNSGDKVWGSRIGENYQIITVTEDTYVPVDFGTWFVCNAAKWEAAASETSEATAAIFNIPFSEVCYIPTNKDDLMSA